MITLDRIDSVPLLADDFSYQFKAWLSVLVDTLNEIMGQLEIESNQVQAPHYTTAQIATLALTDPNGSLYYNTTTNHLYALINGVVTLVV